MQRLLADGKRRDIGLGNDRIVPPDLAREIALRNKHFEGGNITPHPSKLGRTNR